MFDPSFYHSIMKRNRLSVLRQLFLAMVSLVLLTYPPAAYADIQSPRGKKEAKKEEIKRDEERLKEILAVPTPQAQTVRVLRGETITIPLRVVTANNRRVEFRISDNPTAGRLGPLRPTLKKDEATVTYTADPKSRASTDRLSFRARHLDGEMSGSAVVTIEIIDPVPELTFNEEIDFGPTVVGEITERPLTLTNRGTGLFSEKLTMPPPFHLSEKNATITIPANQARTIKIAFMPWAAAYEEKTLSFNSGSTRTIKLRGQGQIPMQAEPALVKIDERNEHHERRGVVMISSLANDPIDISIAPIEGIKIEPTWLKLPPKATQSVQLTLPADQKKEVRRLLRLSARGTQLEVPVIAPAEPARLVWIKPDDQTTLTVPPLPASVTFEIANHGGEAAMIFADAPSTLKIENFENGTTLEAERSIKITTRLQKSIDNFGSGELKLNYNSRQLIIPFTVTPPAEDSAEEAKKVLHSQTTLTQAASSHRSVYNKNMSEDEKLRQDLLSIYGVFIGPIEFSDDVTCPPKIYIDTKKITQNGFEVAWDEPPPGNYQYQVFREELKPLSKNQLPVRQWIRWNENVKFSRANGKVIATFFGLTPMRRYTMRVSTILPDGKVSNASDPFYVSTQAPRSYKKYLYGGIALIFLYGLWRWHRYRTYQYF